MSVLYDTVIHGGTLVTPDGPITADLGVGDGRIEAISEQALTGRERIDARGLHVLPGAIDMHVHFSEPGRTHWEGWATGTRAAAAGGVTTVVDMPLNAIPATTDVHALELKLAAARTQSIVDYALWGGLVDNNLNDLAGLAQAGVVGFKAFMVDIKDDTFHYAPEPILREGMRRIAGLGAFLAVHAEDTQRAWERTARLQAEGRNDLSAWLEARDPQTELLAIQTALLLARETDCPLYVVHNSLPEGIALLHAAKQAGQHVRTEVCLHHLLLDDSDFLRLGNEAKCAPPLRDRERVEALWSLLAAGQVDVVASDHSPCPPADKLGNVWQAWGGITGLQTLLPLWLSEGRKRGFPLTTLSNLISTRPAQIAGLADRKGAVGVGQDADLVLVDFARSWKVTEDWLQYKHPHSPFLGWQVQGWLERTLRRGQTVMQGGGRVSTEAGGEWLVPIVHPLVKR